MQWQQAEQGTLAHAKTGDRYRKLCKELYKGAHPAQFQGSDGQENRAGEAKEAENSDCLSHETDGKRICLQTRREFTGPSELFRQCTQS